MDLSQLPGREKNPIYAQVHADNSFRHYHFLATLIDTAVATQTPHLDEWRIKAINYQAIVMLHSSAGEYRSVQVTVGTHTPPRIILPFPL